MSGYSNLLEGTGGREIAVIHHVVYVCVSATFNELNNYETRVDGRFVASGL